VTVSDTARSLENLKLERDAIVLYDALAGIERDERRSAAFRHIASNERRHAEIWANRLRELGVDVPPAGPPRLRIRFIVALARLLGTRAVSDLVQALEGDEEELYDAQAGPEVESIAADEREHAEIWRRLEAPTQGGSALLEAPPRGVGRREAPIDGRRREGSRRGFRLADPARNGRQVARQARTPAEIGLAEGWHRNAQTGTLRAIIFGVSDGLVSNLSLVMGVAGASGGAGDQRFILLAGIAGLLAGACSMAAGEYVSMQSQRELFERQIELERAELEAMPEEEEAELATVFRSKGFSPEEAARIAHRLFQDPETALDTLVREELGLDPDELGSPWGAAAGSFAAFAVGAVIPVVPYLIGSGPAAFVATLALSLAALFAVGAGVSLLTGRSTLFSGARQVGIGAAAAGVTFVVGHLLGVTVG
jgi:VIT1/CCC1 family predicted Fe2+/Mn2+ transporter/rubrerythrin